MSSRHVAGVGECDGDGVGEIVGEPDGASVGDDDGPALGPAVGLVDGDALGDCVGPCDGDADGLALGPALGPALGLVEGPALGPALGDHDGDAVGRCVSHVPSSLHRPLTQSRGPSTHFLPAQHGAQSPPPQSTDVSRPFRMSSSHVATLGLTVGPADGLELGLVLGSDVGSCVVQLQPTQAT